MPHLPLVQPQTDTDNSITMNTFLRGSYSHAKKQLQGGMDFLADGVTFLKEEFSFMYDRTSNCLNRMALPVNNFLKDITQIEAEFQQELIKESGQFICMEGKMIPVEEVLSQPMEENY